MKKLNYLLVMALFLGACQAEKTNDTDAGAAISEAKNSMTAEEEDIAKELIQGVFDNVWTGLDSSLISQYQTSDFIILEHGEIWTNDNIKQYIREQLAGTDRPKRQNYIDYISIEKYGETMQVAYHNYADFISADTIMAKAEWLESALIVRTDVGWRLKMMHSTRVKRN